MAWTSHISSTGLRASMRRQPSHVKRLCGGQMCCRAAHSPATRRPSSRESSISDSEPHTPVMVRQTLQSLYPIRNGVFLDATGGSLGHTRHLLDHGAAQVYACDVDELSVEAAKAEISNYPGRLLPIKARFSDLLMQMSTRKTGAFDGILFDLGVSSMQLDTGDRGFSFTHNGFLSMLMEGQAALKRGDVSAADVVNCLTSSELAQLLKAFGDERYHSRIARAICNHRSYGSNVESDLGYFLMSWAEKCHEALMATCTETLQAARGDPNGNVVLVPSEERAFWKVYRALSKERPSEPQWWSSTQALSKTIKAAVDKRLWQEHLHPATRSFMAIRIFVNDEFREIEAGLCAAGRLLAPGGRLAVISFNELEDRIVRKFLASRRPASSHERSPEQHQQPGSEPSSGGQTQQQLFEGTSMQQRKKLRDDLLDSIMLRRCALSCMFERFPSQMRRPHLMHVFLRNQLARERILSHSGALDVAILFSHNEWHNGHLLGGTSFLPSLARGAFLSQRFKGVLHPTAEEIQRNPRARSALLRSSIVTWPQIKAQTIDGGDTDTSFGREEAAGHELGILSDDDPEIADLIRSGAVKVVRKGRSIDAPQQSTRESIKQRQPKPGHTRRETRSAPKKTSKRTKSRQKKF